MATAQQLLDLKYNRQIAEDHQYLHDNFSPSIIAELYRQNTNPISNITTTTTCNLYNLNDTTITGLNKLKNLTDLRIVGLPNINSGVNLSYFKNIQRVEIDYCPNLGNIYQIIDCKSASSIAIRRTNMTDFIYKINPEYAGIDDYTSQGASWANNLVNLDLRYNKLTVAAVDFIIHMLHQYNSTFETPIINTIDLSGGTNGIPTSNEVLTGLETLMANNGGTLTYNS